MLDDYLIMNWTLILFLLLIVILLIWLIKAKKRRECITAAIAIIAAAIAILSAFSNVFFPFKLKVITNNIWLTSSPENPSLLVPLTFLNRGADSAIIEYIWIKIENKNSVKLYSAINEIDLTEFIRGKRKLHADNIIGPYLHFPIARKSAIQKCLLFRQEMQSEKYPLNLWIPGKYIFRIYIKHSNSNKSKQYDSITFKITQEILNSCKKDSTECLLITGMPDI